MNPKILAIHGGYNSSITFVDNNNRIRLFELERFVKVKNATFECDDIKNDDDLEKKKKFLELVKSELKCEPKYILYSYLSKEYLSLVKQYFKDCTFVLMGHHTSHCIGAYQQSGFKDALVISLDGGGVDYSYYGISKEPDGTEISYSILEIFNGDANVLATTNSPGAMEFTPGSYTAVVPLISEIDAFKSNVEIDEFIESLKSGNSTSKQDSPFWKLRTLSRISAGKLMGLAAYGNIKDEWIDLFKKMYMVHPKDANNPMIGQFIMLQIANVLGRSVNQNCLSGQESYDAAATNQYVFEELCFELIKPYIDNSDLDIVFSGGCALNVLFNQRISNYLKQTNRKLFVSHTPSDEGISYGHCCSIDKKMNGGLSPYSGLDILDRNRIPEYYDRYNKVGKVIKLS